MNYISALRQRYATMPNAQLREAVILECEKFISSSPNRDEVKKRLSECDDFKFWQQLSEVLVAFRLREAEGKFLNPKSGPDFRAELNDKIIHVEVITPEPEGLPLNWINHVHGNAISLPHEEILLRWTAAIKDKSEKFLGKRDGSRKGYLDKGVVNQDDICIIAINSRLLRGFNGLFDEINGISQFPYAAEAVFCLGPLQAKIDRTTMEITECDYQYRSEIKKPNGVGVPTDTFFDPRFSPISAIWALDIDESILVGRFRPMAIVHNPNARNPLPRKVLPAQVEYFAQEFEDVYKLMSSVGLSGQESDPVSSEN